MDAFDLVSKQLEVYQESWKQEHEIVKQLWWFEDQLAIGNCLYEAIHGRYWSWRSRVERGVLDYSQKDEKALKARFKDWFRPGVQVEVLLNQLEQTYGNIEGGAEFRGNYSEAKRILETWTSPMPPREVEKAAMVTAHTDKPSTMEQLRKDLDRVSKPAAPNVPLPQPIDSNKVF